MISIVCRSQYTEESFLRKHRDVFYDLKSYVRKWDRDNQIYTLVLQTPVVARE